MLIRTNYSRITEDLLNSITACNTGVLGGRECNELFRKGRRLLNQRQF